MNIPSYTDALTNLLKFVSKVGQDPNQTEEIKKEAAAVTADFLVAAMMEIAKKKTEVADEKGARLHSVIDRGAQGAGVRCTRCHGMGTIIVPAKYNEHCSEYETCPQCGGAGSGIV